jgi:hypothetical protein
MHFLVLLNLFGQDFRLYFKVGEFPYVVLLQIWAVITKVKSLFPVPQYWFNLR